MPLKYYPLKGPLKIRYFNHISFKESHFPKHWTVYFDFFIFLYGVIFFIKLLILNQNGNSHKIEKVIATNYVLTTGKIQISNRIVSFKITSSICTACIRMTVGYICLSAEVWICPYFAMFITRLSYLHLFFMSNFVFSN